MASKSSQTTHAVARSLAVAFFTTPHLGDADGEFSRLGLVDVEIQAIGKAKAAERSHTTANRYLALLRAVLKRAAGPWQWIEKAPAVTLYPEAKRRVRWLTKEEVIRLMNALPPHQRQLARFALHELEMDVQVRGEKHQCVGVVVACERIPNEPGQYLTTLYFVDPPCKELKKATQALAYGTGAKQR
jgi:hypothetical protein